MRPNNYEPRCVCRSLWCFSTCITPPFLAHLHSPRRRVESGGNTQARDLVKIPLQFTCTGCPWRGHPFRGSSFTLLRQCCKPGSLPGILRIYWDNPAKISHLWLKQASLLHSGGIWPHTGSPWLPANHMCSVRGSGNQLIQPCTGLGSHVKAVIQVKGGPHRFGVGMILQTGFICATKLN